LVRGFTHRVCGLYARSCVGAIINRPTHLRIIPYWNVFVTSGDW